MSLSWVPETGQGFSRPEVPANKWRSLSTNNSQCRCPHVSHPVKSRPSARRIFYVRLHLLFPPPEISNCNTHHMDRPIYLLTLGKTSVTLHILPER
jgi:hypothetical protein